MKIVVLDGYTENPGDLSWGGLEALGEVTAVSYTHLDVYKRQLWKNLPGQILNRNCGRYEDRNQQNWLCSCNG